MNNTQSTGLIFELSNSGRRCHRLPKCDVPNSARIDSMIPKEHLAKATPPLPEVGEIDLIRHFTNLSTKNMCIDTNFYPLGSCTMKYNPKRHERFAAMPGFANLDIALQPILNRIYDSGRYSLRVSYDRPPSIRR